MITFYPIGRLGNLMFQTAATLGYARKFNYSWGVPRDTREVPRFHQMFPGLPICDDFGRRYKEHPDTICNEHGTHFDVCHYDYHNLENRGDSVCLFGFYQSWRYFYDVREEVKKRFELDLYPGFEDYVSLHWRLGDYVIHSKSFPPINTEYIKLATDHFKGQKVLVFSDDIQHCKDQISTHLPDIKVDYCEENDERKSLSIMASCGNHIIANSSFSYWGAYLGHNPNKKVISPSCERGNWFGMNSGVVKDAVDLLPPEWTQIKFR